MHASPPPAPTLQGGPPASSPGILPGKAEKRNRRARASTLAIAVAVLAAAPAALAGDEPRLVETFPADQGAERSINVPAVTATYDRDLDPFHSKLKVFNHDDVQVEGFVEVSGPPSETGGKRTIRFTPVAPLSEAASPYTARATAVPLASGGHTHTVWTFEIDDTPPAPPVITDPQNGEVRDDQPLVVLGTTEAGAWIEIVEAGEVIAIVRADPMGLFAVELPYPPEDGVTHTIAAVAIDVAGNRSHASAMVTFVHDSIEVVPLIVTPAEGEHLDNTSVLVSGTAKPGSTVTIREGGSAVGTAIVTGDGEWATTITFAEGPHVITAEAFDGINLDGPSAARSFTVDLTPPPVPTILEPAEGAAVPTHDVVVSGTAEAGGFVEIREGTLLRATIPVDGAGGWSEQIGFSSGSHTITATAIDRAGNASAPSAQRTFVVDTAAPAAPAITQPAQNAFLSATPVTVAGTAEPNATVRVMEGTALRGSASVDGAGSWSVAIAFPEGTHLIHGIAVDQAGNQSPRSLKVGFTVDTVPPPAPTITHPVEGAVLNHADVFVGGGAESGSTVEVYEGTTLRGSATVDGSSSWSITITFGGGPHTITAVATDLAGNTGPPSEPRSFAVATTADMIPPPAPTITLPAENAVVGPNPVFRGTAEPGATVRVVEGAVTIGSSTANTSGTWQFAALLPGGPHTVTAAATDRAGNTGPSSPPRSFTVDAVRPTVSIDTPDLSLFLPTSPPVITGSATDDLAVAQIEITATNLITGATDGIFLAACSACPGPSVTWEASPSLGPGIYEIRAWASDRAANRSPPSSITIIVI